MPKRGADNYLTQRGEEEQPEDEPTENGDANGDAASNGDAAPTRRVIRGLPKRARGGAGNGPAPAAPAAPVVPPATSGNSIFNFSGRPQESSQTPLFGANPPPSEALVTQPAPTNPKSASTTSTSFNPFTFGSAASAPNPSGNSSAPFSFASAASETPTFTFGTSQTSSQGSSSTEAPKPAFTFGAANPQSSQDNEADAPTFTFGSGIASNGPTSSSNSFSFGSTTGATGENKSDPPRFTFGSNSTSNGASSSLKPFSFSSSNDNSAPSSTFSFDTTAKPSIPSASFTFSSSAPSAFGPSSSSTFGISPAQTNPSASDTVSNGAAIPPASTSSNGAERSTRRTPVPTLDEPPAIDESIYWSNLHGLNIAVLEFLQSALEQDPFLDLGRIMPEVLKQYSAEQEEFIQMSGWSPPGHRAPQNSHSASIDTSPSNAVVPPASKPSPGVALPASTSSNPFSFGGMGGASSASTASIDNATTSSQPSASKSSMIPTPKKQTSEDVKKMVLNAISPQPTVSASPSIFSFGSSAPAPAAPLPPQEAKKTSTSTLFPMSPTGPLKPGSPDSKTFTPSKDIESASTTAGGPGASTPRLGRFGPGGSQPNLSFGGFSTSPTSSTSTSKPVGFGFGSASSGTGNLFSGNTASSTSSTNTTAFPSSAFNFGSTKPAGAPPPSGFLFGSGSASAVPTAGTTPLFGTASTSYSAPASGSATPMTSADPSNEGTPEESVPSSPSKNYAELQGEGEENEDTVTSYKVRLMKLAGGKFETVGQGLVKLKRSKDGSGARNRRLLLRADSGIILMNMAIKDSFDPIAQNNFIRFLGADLEGKPQPYGFKIRNKEMADEFVGVMKKEVEDLKAKKQ